MCLIAVAYNATPEFELIAVANRDEFYGRPAEPLHLWESSELAKHAVVAGGRDLQAGGTWLATSRFKGSRRFAAVTNYRNPDQTVSKRSRGMLVTGFLAGNLNAADFAKALQDDAMNYGGYNLLLLDDSGLHYCTNRWPAEDELVGFQARHQILEAGVYVLSNHLLDSPWPKSLRLREKVRALLASRDRKEVLNADGWLDLMGDPVQASADELPNTGMPVQLERQLSSAFIRMPGYGTRSSTVVTIGTGLWCRDWHERASIRFHRA